MGSHRSLSCWTLTSPDSGLLDVDVRKPEGLLRVPGAALTVLSHRLSADGIPARGYWAQVPQYVNGPFHQGAIALLERVADRLGVSIPLDSLPEEDPYFLFLHLYDAHGPWNPEGKYKEIADAGLGKALPLAAMEEDVKPFARYRGDVAMMDDFLIEMLAELEKHDPGLENTVSSAS